jgi:hypothetical protein
MPKACIPAARRNPVPALQQLGGLRAPFFNPAHIDGWAEHPTAGMRILGIGLGCGDGAEKLAPIVRRRHLPVTHARNAQFKIIRLD